MHAPFVLIRSPRRIVAVGWTHCRCRLVLFSVPNYLSCPDRHSKNHQLGYPTDLVLSLSRNWSQPFRPRFRCTISLQMQFMRPTDGHLDPRS